jgi:hypothetical protein
VIAAEANSRKSGNAQLTLSLQILKVKKFRPILLCQLFASPSVNSKIRKKRFVDPSNSLITSDSKLS